MIVQIMRNRLTPSISSVRDAIQYVAGADREQSRTVNENYYDHHLEKDLNLGQFFNLEGNDNEERCAYWSASGFDGEKNIDNAIKDMALMQSLYNGKGNEHNLYHMVAAFPPGELPTTAILADVEKTLVEGLGFTNHQHVSGVHIDKGHIHMHIVINKINDDLKKHTPYNDYKKCRTMAAHLEHKHGLVKTDHRTKLERKDRSAFTRADDIQRLSGRPSLNDWAKSQALPDIYSVLDDKSITSWDAMHHVFAINGLAIRKRGAGLVFQDINTGIFCKSSGVSRQLGHGALVKRYGAYSLPSFDINEVVPTRTYAEKRFKGFVKGMYSEYLEDRKALSKLKYSAKYEARQSFYADAKSAWADYKSSMELLRGKQLPGKAYIAQKLGIQIMHYSRLADCQQRFHDTMHVIKKDMDSPAFIDYVSEKALKGDVDALNRINDVYSTYYGQQHNMPLNGFNLCLNGVSSFDTSYATLAPNSFYSKHGGLYTRLNDGSLMFTQSKRVWVNAKSDKALVTALMIAKSKYGQTIELTGDSVHIRRAVALAKQQNMNITFSGARRSENQNIIGGDNER